MLEVLSTKKTKRGKEQRAMVKMELATANRAIEMLMSKILQLQSSSPPTARFGSLEPPLPGRITPSDTALQQDIQTALNSKTDLSNRETHFAHNYESTSITSSSSHISSVRGTKHATPEPMNRSKTETPPPTIATEVTTGKWQLSPPRSKNIRSMNISNSETSSSDPQVLPEEYLFVKPLGFRPNSRFVGRELELIELNNLLFNKERRSRGTSAVSLQSLPGGGKTHLARE
jgi:hypothetical protein